MLINATLEEWLNSIDITIEQLITMEKELSEKQIAINYNIADLCQNRYNMSDEEYKYKYNQAFVDLRNIAANLNRIYKKRKILDNHDQEMAQEYLANDFNSLKEVGIKINLKGKNFEELSFLYQQAFYRIEQLLSEEKITVEKSNLLKDEIYVVFGHAIKKLKIKKLVLTAA